MEHKGSVRIETERLILRRITMDDVEAAFRNWESDDRVTEFLRWPTARGIAQVEQVTREWVNGYADPAFYQWVIVPKDLNEPIGTISVVDMDERTDKVHIGYCIGRAWWRQGVMTEALQAVMAYLFDVVGYNRLESRHDPRNPNSGAVMRKCGMKYEGTYRQSDWNNQGVCDACWYALLKSER